VSTTEIAKYGDVIPGLEGAEDDLAGGGGDIIRLKFSSRDAEFENPDTGETFDSIEGVVLGRVMQRIAWAPDGNLDASSLLGDAKDGKNGVSNPENIALLDDPNDFTPHADGDCSNCAMQVWGSHPTRETSWCSQNYSLAILAKNPETDEPQVMVVSFGGKSVAHVRKWLRIFNTKKVPPFAQVTEITLLKQKTSGGFKFSTPVFKEKGQTDPDQHADFIEAWEGAKSYMTYRKPSGEAVEAAVEVVASKSNAVADAFPGATVEDADGETIEL